MVRFQFALLFVIFVSVFKNSAAEEASVLTNKLNTAVKKVADEQEYRLSYKLAVGDVVRSKVSQLVTIDTKIKGNEQTARSRSISNKHWKVEAIDAKGNIRFVHQIDDVDMWESVTGRQEVKYNSREDKKVPANYEIVADSIGKPLATITITPQGKIISRDDAVKKINPGIGDLTIPFPETPIKVGAEWGVPEEIPLRQEDRAIKKVQVRQLYRLTKVETDVATILVETQILTPVNDPKLQSQLVQRMQRGTIKFDISTGRLLSKVMELNETVLGFNGADSSMHYLAKFSEEAIAATEVATKPAANATK